MELKEALQAALDFEKKGHKIYEETSNKTENSIVSRTFRYLADQELVHIAEIEEFIGILNNGEDIELKGDKLEDTKKFFSMTVKEFKEKTELSGDDLKAHEAGLQLEKNAYNFYKEQLEKTSDPKAKRFFEWVMEQESAHYQLIQNAYEFIKSPDMFFAEEEKWIVEG